MIYEIELKERTCPYCGRKVMPTVVKFEKEYRLYCPRCELTIEVIKRGKRDV